MTPFFAFITSFLITFLVIPSVIKGAYSKKLFDEPCSRKNHKGTIPNLGGVGLFGGIIFSLSFWATYEEIKELKYIVSALIVIFFIGLNDDIMNMRAIRKLFGQIIAAFIIVHFAEIRLNTFYGLFGIQEISLELSYILSMFTIIVITNSFNLIDGIDGLTGSVAVLTSLIFGIWFFVAGYTQYALISFSIVGAALAFLKYNISPAKIFMGDTGSLLVGLLLGVLAIKFIEINRLLPHENNFKVFSVPVVTIGILIIPLFDTLRVFIIRVLDGRSPLSADRNHLHHLLLELGCSHSMAVVILVLFNLLVVSIMFTFQSLRGELLLFVLLGVSLVATLVLKNLRKRLGKSAHGVRI
jgi:UDP-GlcNAc:undecaprenyl-phosphate/decaprenyl-phosphate GlcNAc-1-phosphate transferase